MTGGVAVVLGPTGRNFAAGMSGGVAYVYDKEGVFEKNCNTMMANLVSLDKKDKKIVSELIEKHVKYTNSAYAAEILKSFDELSSKFVKVLPKDYARMLDALSHVEADGLTGDKALMAAFTAVTSEGKKNG